MDKYIKSRVLKEANYMLKTKKTIRELAEEFSVSKSTIHTDLSLRLIKINKKIADEIKVILNSHNKTKHLHGGATTKEKYKRGKEDESKQYTIFKWWYDILKN